MTRFRIITSALLSLSFLAGCATAPMPTGKRELMIVGNDEKQSWDDAGKAVIGEPGRDSVSIIDIGTDPLAPNSGLVPVERHCGRGHGRRVAQPAAATA